MTKLTLQEFFLSWFKRNNVQDAIDALSSDLGEEFYIALSTAYGWLSLIRQWCHLHFSVLGIDPNHLNCLSELRSIDGEVAARAIGMGGISYRGFPRIDKPP